MWSVAKYGDPYSEFVLCIYPIQVHTHSSEHTHTRSSGQPIMRRPGSSWGIGALLKGVTSVMLLKVERTLVIHDPHRQFLPDPRFEPTTSGYKSDALSIRPRLLQW